MSTKEERERKTMAGTAIMAYWRQTRATAIPLYRSVQFYIILYFHLYRFLYISSPYAHPSPPTAAIRDTERSSVSLQFCARSVQNKSVVQTDSYIILVSVCLDSVWILYTDLDFCTDSVQIYLISVQKSQFCTEYRQKTEQIQKTDLYRSIYRCTDL